MNSEKKTIIHITNNHSAFDDRIFYKELCSLTKEYNCYELTATKDGKRLTNMSGKLLEQGVYDNVHCLAYSANRMNFVIRCMRKFLPFIYYPISATFEAKRILKVLQKENIQADLIHFHDLVFAPVALKLKRKLCCKTIFDSHEFFFSYPFNAGLTKKTTKKATMELLKWKKAIKGSDFVIGCTKTMNNLISLIRQDDRHGIVYNSSMFEAKTQKRTIEGKEKIVLLHEGAMPFNRGLKLMLEIFRDEYIREHFQLRIVGTIKGAEKAYYEEKCQEYNLTEDNIYFTGWVDYIDVPKELQGDIGILFFEKAFNTFYSMPNKLYNYHVAGVPVLATQCAELSDTIKEYGTGVIVERNVEAVKRGLMNIVENYSDFQERVLENQKKFHWSSDEVRLFEIYDTVLE